MTDDSGKEFEEVTIIILLTMYCHSSNKKIDSNYFVTKVNVWFLCSLPWLACVEWLLV